MIVCPSLLSIDKENYNETVKQLVLSGINKIHVDLMDGKFVKEQGVDISLINIIKESSPNIIVDTHLMVKNPKDEYIDKVIELGADEITIHVECEDKNNSLEDIISYIREKKSDIKIGIALNPKTKIETIDKFINRVDKILIMSVDPGKSGQTFNEKVLRKVKYVWDKKISDRILNLTIQVDGGINPIVARTLKLIGVNEIVVGSYIFMGEIKTNIETLRNI